MFAQLRTKIQTWNRKRRVQRFEKREAYTGHDCRLGVLGIMKNEAMNIDEWVQHYLSMGAGKIFLIDNGSSDETVGKAKLWVAKGVVELVEYAGQQMQRQHYWSAFKELKIAKKCQWLIVADLDEFWFCPSGETIAAQLSDFTFLDLIYANWRMFGSNGLDKHPASVRQSFTMRAPELHRHKERKYMCRTSVIKSKRTLGIHTINGARSNRTVSDNERFHLNHYGIQSIEYFQKVKMTRGDAASIQYAPVRDLTYFQERDAPCTMSDHLLADLVASGKIK
ncbi:glycosyltransferase family 2 protein [Cypionkella sp.]|uniref:glycosyltransferase family 2 protein n=1 Tax=Cypionkella sp. TaxID=2811411 RepID=UPI00271D46C4|nr:glycosyltransferase family 2 protein [Cypionkella sp.]MDO8985337.1 glycosyltransferase family 2 protein [Cypionkella sp.]